MNEDLFIQPLNSVLVNFSVKAAYFFGSQNSGGASNSSDFDIALFVEDRNAVNVKNLLRAVTDVFIQPEKLHLSIVDLKNTSPLFLFQIIKNGKLIYEKNANERVEQEANVMRFYYDDQHRENIYFQNLKKQYAN